MGSLRQRYLPRAAIVLLAMAVPLFLITTNLRVVINSGWLYSFGFDRYGVADYTGIEKPELMRVAREIKAYFNSPSDAPLNVRAVVYGQEQDLFNAREIRHMKDVKGLVRGLAFWQRVSFLYILGFAAVGLVLWRRQLLRRLATGLLWGGALTIGLMAAAGIGSLIGFDALFTQFHVLSFSNDFWQLNPATDNLVRIFPEGFFLIATLIVAGMTLVEAVGASFVAGLYLLRGRRAQRGAVVVPAARGAGSSPVSP